MTAFELLDHLAALKGIGPQRRRWDEVNALLRRTNLYDVRHRKLGTYLGRHEAALRHRPGAAGAAAAGHRGRADGRPGSRGARRFHGLLADIGEEVIVILSTHIVADVSDLCPRMAIINKGKVVLTGEPTQVASALAGRIWRKLVRSARAGRAGQRTGRHRITPLRQRRIAGQMAVHVHAGDARRGASSRSSPTSKTPTSGRSSQRRARGRRGAAGAPPCGCTIAGSSSGSA